MKTVRELIYKRGYGKVNKQRIPLSSNAVIEESLGKFGIISIEDIVHEIATAGPAFKQYVSSSFFRIRIMLTLSFSFFVESPTFYVHSSFPTHWEVPEQENSGVGSKEERLESEEFTSMDSFELPTRFLLFGFFATTPFCIHCWCCAYVNIE